MAGSTFVYVTFIRTTVEEVWSAFTQPEYVKKFWFDIDVETDWRVGSPWYHDETERWEMHTRVTPCLAPVPPSGPRSRRPRQVW